MGAADWYGRELVITLGLWMGPALVMYLEYACTAAARAITKRWPGIQAGFAWGEVKI